MKRKGQKHALLFFFIVFLLLCGTAFAFMFRQTELFENQFDTAVVDCEVHEMLDGSGDYIQGVQSADSKKSITVKNTGNIDAYLRVRFVSYWIDANGNIVAKTSQMPMIPQTADWILGSDYTYYYKKAVAPGAFTEELLQKSIVLATSDEGYFQVVEVFADAIQSLPETAVEESWKVTVENNVITSVSS